MTIAGTKAVVLSTPTKTIIVRNIAEDAKVARIATTIKPFRKKNSKQDKKIVSGQNVKRHIKGDGLKRLLENGNGK